MAKFRRDRAWRSSPDESVLLTACSPPNSATTPTTLLNGVVGEVPPLSPEELRQLRQVRQSETHGEVPSRRHFPPGTWWNCTACHYELRLLVAARGVACPECGAALSPFGTADVPLDQLDFDFKEYR